MTCQEPEPDSGLHELTTRAPSTRGNYVLNSCMQQNILEQYRYSFTGFLLIFRLDNKIFVPLLKTKIIL
jgi:hypothetical protein